MVQKWGEKKKKKKTCDIHYNIIYKCRAYAWIPTRDS
jgi:hypothetical protein